MPAASLLERRWISFATRVVVVVVVAVVYGCVMQVINLPEEIVAYLAAGFGLGIVVGRWFVVLAAFAAISIGLIDAPSDPVLWEVVSFVYVPAAALALAAGVAVRVFVPAALQRSR